MSLSVHSALSAAARASPPDPGSIGSTLPVSVEAAHPAGSAVSAGDSSSSICEVSAAMSSAYLRVTIDRRTFSVGVSSPPSSVKSPGRIVYFLICSALETFEFAVATALSISATRSALVVRSLGVVLLSRL